MGIIAFKLSLVEDLAEKTLKGTSFSPTIDMLFDKKYYHGNVIKDKDGKTQEEIEAEGGHFWPCQKYIDKTLIEPVLQLVGDHGCYLISNVDNGKSPNESGMIVYADGMDPEIDEDYYGLKREKFGGDDGSVTIPIEWVAIARERKSRKFRVNLTATSVSLR